MKRFGALLAGVFLVLFAFASPAQAAPQSLTECSVELYQGDYRLGPAELPSLGSVGFQLAGYDRTGDRPEAMFLDRFYDDDAGSWRYPPADGYSLDALGEPIRWVTRLLPDQQIDRYGSEFGAFLAPRGLPYTSRSIPPSSLVGTPAARCNYRVYEVLRPFAVHAGPIAPWFFQSGGGMQYQLTGALVPGAPVNLSVGWLVANGYLGRVVSPST